MTAEEGAPPARARLAIDASEGWLRAAPGLEALAERAASAALVEAGAPAPCEISLLLTDDARIAELNAAFRGAAKPTNVLSWPALALEAPLDGPAWRALGAQPGAENFLGDVALALETVRREADLSSLRLESHAAHLIVHGVLHLCGYDHESESDAALMETKEARALARIGVADPYARDRAMAERLD